MRRPPRTPWTNINAGKKCQGIEIYRFSAPHARAILAFLLISALHRLGCLANWILLSRYGVSAWARQIHTLASSSRQLLNIHFQELQSVGVKNKQLVTDPALAEIYGGHPYGRRPGKDLGVEWFPSLFLCLWKCRHYQWAVWWGWQVLVRGKTALFLNALHVKNLTWTDGFSAFFILARRGWFDIPS